MDKFELSDLNNLPGSNGKNTFNKGFVIRFYVFFVVFIIFIIVYFALKYSVFNFNKYNTLALQNRLITYPIVADRGIIFDSNMKQLSFNIPTFQVYLNLSNLTNNKILNDESILSKILNIPEEKINKIVQNNVSNGVTNILLDKSVSSYNDVLISSNKNLYGVYISQNYYIKFAYNNLFSNVIGYTGPVTEQDILKNPNLNPYDIVGRYGIEESFNKYLMGTDGTEVKEVNTLGNIVGNYGEQPAIPGDNVELTINSNIQSELRQLLIQNISQNPNHVTGAAAVVENVNNGDILGMVSYPTFNANDFEGSGISSKEYSALLNNPDDPLLNRAISEAQPIGSIMKTILLSAALQENVITPATEILTSGTLMYDGTLFQNYDKIDWGIVNVVKDLRYSVDVFAYDVAIKLGINDFVKYEKLFGLGQKTGIALPGEVPGIISDPASKMSLTGEPWLPGDLLNASIGQGYTEATPIQVVNFISSIANGGILYKPMIVKAILSPSGQIIKNYKPVVIRSGFVSPSNLDVIRQGMYEAVQEGIDIAAKSSFTVNAGKSGTAQFGPENVNNTNDRYSQAHSWMSSFAPYNNPKIAIVVFEENGGLSTYSAEVVKNFMDWYFGVYSKK